MRMTKRRFLQAVGAAAGVGAVYRTMTALGLSEDGTAHASALDAPRGVGDGRTVVILGAGISGMAAAYELSKAGYRCTILEATASTGRPGRVRAPPSRRISRSAPSRHPC